MRHVHAHGIKYDHIHMYIVYSPYEREKYFETTIIVFLCAHL